MQSIYRFRDADVGLFYRAWEDGVGPVALTPVVLSSNFRTHDALVHWTNATFARVMGSRQDPVLGRIAHTNAEATRPHDGDRPPARAGA